MTEQLKELAEGWVGKLVVPIVVGLVTGYMSAQTAIAVLEERVSQLEVRQGIISTQQQADARAMVRVETKVDLLLQRTSP